MSRSYLPTREAQLVTWANDFYRNLSTEEAGFFGVDANVIAQYHTTLTRFLDAYALATNPNTRTGPILEAKDAAKKTLINSTRSMVEVIQAWPQMTDDKRRQLGITVRVKKGAPIPRPTVKPYLEIAGVDQNTITVRIKQSKTDRSKPYGVIGCTLYSAVSPTPPTTESGWFGQGSTTKNSVQVHFPENVAPGSRVWFTAVYYTRRAETGPAANVIGTNLPGGAAFAKAA